ncbi:SEC-C metal-binding domain-containing protein [Chryseomicrobium sp. FSL W7-1435]|uniref:SEC-C metal-binding domain-containing protein n=1 Tax=Chryseomicrobium sp. FSL W7-1435 TaxID=2921704 RepID=UPI00315AEA52
MHAAVPFPYLCLDGNLAVVPGLEHPYSLFDHLGDRTDLEPVELTPMEVVKRASESYFLELPEYKKLAMYLEEMTKLDPDEVESVLFDFGVELNNQVPFNELVNEMFKDLTLLTPGIMQETIRLAKAAQHVTPHYALKGHTPGALFQEEKQQTPIQPPTEIGRNEKCPCGSGKKYKKCCM